MRVGLGYDSHRFDSDRKLILAGVEIPDSPGLAGHSDADAIAHANFASANFVAMPKVELIDTSGLPEVEPRSNLSYSQRVPCKFFFGSGNCTKDPCPFSHDPNCKLPKSHDPTRVKGGDFVVGKGKTNFSGGDFKRREGKREGKREVLPTFSIQGPRKR